MLVQLTISNFAIISRLDIPFKPGLSILSGETGAGKSIIINAVNLILGGRASSDLVRSGSKEATVEALFSLPENPNLKESLADLGFPFNGELLIKRTISREGRNRITINGSLATLQMLSKIGLMLISISGQHEHQLLLKPDSHLYLLDDFGGTTDERLRLRESFNAYLSLKEELDRRSDEIKKGEERLELSRFQIQEIETAQIRAGEDSLLEEEKNRLRHAKELMEILTDSIEVLYERDPSLLGDLTLCIKRVEKGAGMDQRLGALKDTLLSAKVEIEEAALELRGIQNTLVMDPLRLEEVEERRQLLNRLKRKYGPSLEEVLQSRDELTEMVDNLDEERRGLEKAGEKCMEMDRHIRSKAKILSKKREKASKRLEKAVEEELALLDMGGTRFEVRFHLEGDGEKPPTGSRNKPIRGDGYDTVEFMLSPNPGEELRPLSKIASGGELSRIMLALKTILAKTAAVETIIFDEVDSGIGGATAEVVGDKLQSLARYHQILCITHLPQIASKGDTHFLVKKKVKDKRTLTTISELDSGERVAEIARLVGGKVITEQAMAHARSLLG